MVIRPVPGAPDRGKSKRFHSVPFVAVTVCTNVKVLISVGSVITPVLSTPVYESLLFLAQNWSCSVLTLSSNSGRQSQLLVVVL